MGKSGARVLGGQNGRAERSDKHQGHAAQKRGKMN
jgi:hypothetical protein